MDIKNMTEKISSFMVLEQFYIIVDEIMREDSVYLSKNSKWRSDIN